MYLDVTFKDGTVTHIPISNSHTVRIIQPDNNVQDAFAFDGVASISIDFQGAPAATDPNQPLNVGAAEGPTVEEAPATADVLVAASGQPTTDNAPPISDGSNDPAHPDVVSAVQDSVVAAEATPPDDRPALVAKAQADVDEALALWPDSAPLLDAKAQLATLANETV
jgi:hypothetical protein